MLNMVENLWGGDMGILNKIKGILASWSIEQVQNFEDFLVREYGIKKYLYATSEGLPIMGNFNGYEELSAKSPEFFKILSELDPSREYTIITNKKIYLLLRVTSEVILLAELSRVLSSAEINTLIQKTRDELKI